MFPKYNFDDSLAAIERLGKKEVNTHMVRYRMGQLTKDDDDSRILSDTEQKKEKSATHTKNSRWTSLKRLSMSKLRYQLFSRELMPL
jgi:hypothetical protein